MKYIELSLVLKLKEDITYRELPEKLTHGFNYYFLINNKLKEIHKINDFKFYSFGTLTPIEKDKVYKQNKCYSLTMRFMNTNILNDFYKALSMIENPIFSIVSRCFNVVSMDNIEIDYIETLTPAIITYNNRNLDVKNMNLDLVKDRLISNINKKYAKFNNLDKTNYDFIEDIEILNNKSIIFGYKNGVIIGNKYRFKVKKDITSQKLAFICLGAGILEKNGLSFGYCKAITTKGDSII